MTRGRIVLAVMVLAGRGFAAAHPDPGKRITQYAHVAWQQKSGLPDDMVGAILQTRDGYMWFGTLNGLARFDGVRFTIFDSLNSEGALLHRVTSLYQALDGSLWAGSRNGLTRYRDGRFESYPLPSGTPSGGVRQVLEDRQGDVWARTRDELLRLRGQRLELVARPVRAISLGKDGGLRVTTPDGFGRLDGERIVIERRAPPVAGEPSPLALLADVVEEPNGTLWLGGPWGLGRLDPGGQWKVYTKRDGLPDTAVTTLCLDGTGTLWVGTIQGVARLQAGRFVQAERDNPLSGLRIQAIYADGEGAVWVGTDSDGVHRLHDGPFTPLGMQEGLSDELAMPILEARDGSVWIGTPRGLNRVRDERIETFTVREGLSDDTIFALAEDALGTLWIGTGKGLSRYDGKRVRPALAGTTPVPGRVTALALARDGSLWAGTGAGGLYHVERGTATHYTKESGLSDNHVAQLHERPDGSIWIATDDGITVWEQGHLRVLGARDGLPSAQVRAFHEAGGNLWIGTYGGGLCRYRDGRFQAIPAGFPDNVVYAMLEDERHDLWLSSNRGIVRVALAALEALADGRQPMPSFLLYDVGDGLKSSMCVGNFQPAAWKARDGRLWFPTRRGAVWVDPSRPAVHDPPPMALVERVLVDGRPQPLAGGTALPAGRGDLVFDYTAPSFRHPAALRFRYRLDGFDADWQEAGSRRTAQYTKVPPGRYTFRVAALSPDGVSSQEQATAIVQLRPHFYQTSWFLAACASVGLLLAGLLYRAKLAQVRSRFALVLAERNRIAREMHDALDQGFAAITLQLNLAARIAEHKGESPAALKQRLELAARLLEYTRSESKRSISDLRSQALEKGNLVDALNHVAQQFTQAGDDMKIGVSVEGDARRLPGAVENNLLRICQEALANAVRHGQAREIAIKLAFAARSVALLVKDAGLGFDPGSVVSERDGHFGLMGIRERAQRLGGRLRLESAPGRGTEVLVEIPVPE
jgi:ligand-binding sensor domain-containing protein/signal transduction histidine kinase